MSESRPTIAITMGDVAGVGPELVARVLLDPTTSTLCRPVVCGHPDILHRALELHSNSREVVVVSDLSQAAESNSDILCLASGSDDLTEIEPGRVDARCGQAAYDALIHAIDLALGGDVDGVVTAPLNKAALHAAGIQYPGHTEILAERCEVSDFAMMLYLPPGSAVQGEFGLGVAHVTLHTSIRSVPDLLSTEAIREKIRLMDSFLRQIGHPSPRIGVAALNPHAGEEGLFGDEESRLIQPAVEQEYALGTNVSGPIPADALMRRAAAGEFDGVVAMYHDQGHIALKLLGFDQAVNITLGLPIIRTSPSHGTAYDIAWQGQADVTGMQGAMVMACQLVKHQIQS